MLLIIFEDNWADEMDLWSFIIISQEKWQYKVNEMQNTSFPREVCFGTNEYNEYESASDFLSHFEIKTITVEEVEVIKRLFGCSMISSFPLIEGCAPDKFYEKFGYCPD